MSLRLDHRVWLAVLVSFAPAALYWSPTVAPFVPHHRLLLAGVVLATQVIVIYGWTVWRGSPGFLAVIVAVVLGLVQTYASPIEGMVSTPEGIFVVGEFRELIDWGDGMILRASRPKSGRRSLPRCVREFRWKL